MGKQRSIDFDIGFADGRVTSYGSTQTGLEIFFQAWNEKTLKFNCEDIIFFSVLSISDVSDVLERENSLALDSGARYLSLSHEQKKEYRSLQFINLDGDPFIEICCHSYMISIYHENSNFCRLCGLYQKDPPWGQDGVSPNFKTCICCGTTFGRDDCFPSQVLEYRKEWIRNGCPWLDKEKRPYDWSSAMQMLHIPRSFL